MELVTVITPTYNRKSELKNLYYSLCKQTNYDFRWLVVDDGSRDETDQYIEKIKKRTKIQNRIYKKSKWWKTYSFKYRGKTDKNRTYNDCGQ